MIASRWLAVFVFALYTSLNYLDRQTLAAIAPQLRREFNLSSEDYGWLVAAFSIPYAACAPLAGLLIDRIGLTRGAMVTLGVWSLAAIAAGFTETFWALAVCRVVLGAAEAGGIPAYSKATATYLQPRERSLGAGVNSIGVSLGMAAAPLLAVWVQSQWGWRSAFVFAGALGFLWMPLWLMVSARVPAPVAAAAAKPSATPAAMIRDRALWGLVIANILIMTCYSLWTNWTTELLVQRYGLAPAYVNRTFAWMPPVFASLGGLAGGWIVLKWSGAGVAVQAARNRVMWMAGVALLATSLVPRMPNAALATIVICASFFCCMAMSANLYAIPQDLFGPGRAAFALSAITAGYGAMQTVYSPFVGRMVDRWGFEPVCAITAVAPLAGWLVLKQTERAG